MLQKFKLFACLLVFAGTLTCHQRDAARRFEPRNSDAAALAIVDSIQVTLGARNLQNEIGDLRFEFALLRQDSLLKSRTHFWNRRSGDYRLDWQEQDSLHISAFFNIHTREGTARVNGKTIADSLKLRSVLGKAYAIYINDTYWLLMPYKLKDPGVRLKYVGRRQRQGKDYQVLHVSFDAVGLTPENEYDLFVNAETFRIERWEYFARKGAPAASFTWENWQRYNGSLFALRHRTEQADLEIAIRNLHLGRAEEPVTLKAAQNGMVGPIPFR